MSEKSGVFRWAATFILIVAFLIIVSVGFLNLLRLRDPYLNLKDIQKEYIDDAKTGQKIHEEHRQLAASLMAQVIKDHPDDEVEQWKWEYESPNDNGLGIGNLSLVAVVDDCFVTYMLTFK